MKNIKTLADIIDASAQKVPRPREVEEAHDQADAVDRSDHAVRREAQHGLRRRVSRERRLPWGTGHGDGAVHQLLGRIHGVNQADLLSLGGADDLTGEGTDRLMCRDAQ